MRIFKGQLFFNKTDLSRELEIKSSTLVAHLRRGSIQQPKHKLDQSTEKGKHKKRPHWNEEEYKQIVELVRELEKRKQEAQ